MIKQILFDLGGVFIKHTRSICVQRFEALGIHDADALLDPYCQSGIFLDLESGVHTEESFTELVNQQYGLALEPRQIGHAIHGFVEQIEDYKFDYIEQLPEHIGKLLISNTNPFIWNYAESGQMLQNGRKVSSYFDHCYTSFEMQRCKPDPIIFEEIIEQSEIDPRETLFIDDGPNNTATARELGFITYCPDNGEDWTPLLTKMLMR